MFVQRAEMREESDVGWKNKPRANNYIMKGQFHNFSQNTLQLKSVLTISKSVFREQTCVQVKTTKEIFGAAIESSHQHC